MSQDLGIELALESAGGAFISKYRLMKDRLLNVEYEHWAAGFPEGNNHGQGHINRVLGHLNELLGPTPLRLVNHYELFLAMMSVLYHDIGLLRQREGHADISALLLEMDRNDGYVINEVDKSIIAAAVVSHSSSKDIAKECAHFSAVEHVGEDQARPAVIAALVRLADELDEDYRRADPVLQERLEIPETSKFFWRFCQRIRSVKPDLNFKRIDINLALKPEDLTHIGVLPNGGNKSFVAFVAEKLHKLNVERVVVNRYLPPELQYGGLHIDLKPIKGHETWKSPRTFVFNDQTTSEMFLLSLPELYSEPVNHKIESIVKLINEGSLVQALDKCKELESVVNDLPKDVKVTVPYELACIHSKLAADAPNGSKEKSVHLEAAFTSLLSWYQRGSEGGWKAMGKIPSQEVHRMAADRDLRFLRDQKRDQLRNKIPLELWPTARSGGGCVPRGTIIDTPDGLRAVESLRVGDRVYSVRLQNEPILVVSELDGIVTSRKESCICINDWWLATEGQRVRSSNSWVRVGDLHPGDLLFATNLAPLPVRSVSRLEDYFEIFDLSIKGPHHNYLANGILCHNNPAQRK